jgi:hypothetical protein
MGMQRRPRHSAPPRPIVKNKMSLNSAIHMKNEICVCVIMEENIEFKIVLTFFHKTTERD